SFGAGTEGSTGQSVTLGFADHVDADFGFAPTASVGDQVYIDNNANSRFDVGDTPIDSAIVQIFNDFCPADLSTLTTPLAVATSDAAGLYDFSALADGNYCVIVLDPGAGDALEGAAGQSVTLTGVPLRTADFGFLPAGAIGDQAYIDTDLSDSFAGADTAVVGLLVELFSNACPADLTTLTGRLASTTTDSSGNYLFENLPAATYCVVARPTFGNEAREGSAGWTIAIDGNTDTTADFGFSPVQSIGDTVYIDSDSNSTQDAGELGILGAQVELFSGACPAAGAAINATTTDFNGEYAFDELAPGDYCVTVDYTGAGAATEGAGGVSVTLTNADNLDADFGFMPAGAIGDLTYIDVDGDNVFDASDIVLDGVTVELYDGTCPADLTTLTGTPATTT
ncbi:MAG: SdrD B-like domain-containing protein, partial [Halioglobus sp.]